MRAVVQRVSGASVAVEGQVRAGIGAGLLVFAGVGRNDTEDDARMIAHRIAHLRIFSDADGKMNLSVMDVKGAVLLISQFTLHADTRKGYRPSFMFAMAREPAEALLAVVAKSIEGYGVPVATGVFGAMMTIDAVNEGPVTIILDTKDREKPK
jgi:D-tyrosyl-tRNA(Tyr) deacylase